MSSNSFAATVDLRLRPSLRALQVLFALHVACAGLLLFAMEPGIPMALIGASILGSWAWLRRHPAFGFGRRALSHIVWHADGRWLVAHPGGEAFAVELQGSSYVHPRLLVLNFRDGEGRRHTRVLLGDETEAELLRRLRARLSTGAPSP